MNLILCCFWEIIQMFYCLKIVLRNIAAKTSIQSIRRIESPKRSIDFCGYINWCAWDIGGNGEIRVHGQKEPTIKYGFFRLVPDCSLFQLTSWMNRILCSFQNLIRMLFVLKMPWISSEIIWKIGIVKMFWFIKLNYAHK